MTNRYIDLIKQTYNFPQEGFDVINGKLYFYEIDLFELIKEHGSPLRISYLPKIRDHIKLGEELFQNAFKKHNYSGQYFYCFCTKSSHFSFVIKTALEAGSHLETSSSFDIDLIRQLIKVGYVNEDTQILCNGFKLDDYIQKISALVNEGYQNVMPIFDNKEEISNFKKHLKKTAQIGIRVASNEAPTFDFYTSRLGISSQKVVQFYKDLISDDPIFDLKMLHFFINTGIKDDIYYWGELTNMINIYIELKKLCPSISRLNLGGGLPIRYDLNFEYDYQYMIEEIISLIKQMCDDAGVEVPDIYTEFGNFTVGESGVLLFDVLGEKTQNDTELWYMLNGSLMTTIPDIYSINQPFILLPINHWEKEYKRVYVGGLSCDGSDYYHSDPTISELFLPKKPKDEPLYLGFFHIGAYQEALSGYGGTKHCLIPSPKHIIIDKKEDGSLDIHTFSEAQNAPDILRILGYDT